MSKRNAMLLVVFLSCPTVCTADSITVTYENVYISEHSDSFFIRIPADGTVVRLLKSGVSDSRVSLTEDENARNALLQEWERHRKKPGESPKALSVSSAQVLAEYKEASADLVAAEANLKQARQRYSNTPNPEQVISKIKTTVGALPAAQSGTPSSQQPQSRYKVIERKFFNVAAAKRLLYRLEVPEPVTEAKLRSVCNTLIDREKAQQPLNAILFAFFLPGTDTQGHYTAGKADWAPNGKWERADSVRSGDYSRHKLVVEVGSAVGEYTGTPETSISESKRRQIYWDLRAAENSATDEAERIGPGHDDYEKQAELSNKLREKYKEEVARQYGLSKQQVSSINEEGAMKGWPRPHTHTHYASLKVGKSYRLLAETPLMPEFEPSGIADILDALRRVRTLPLRSSIVVKRIRMNGATPWYYVQAFDQNDRPVGEGWINDVALWGDIEILK